MMNCKQKELSRDNTNKVVKPFLTKNLPN